MHKLFSLLIISLLLLSCENSNKQSSQNQNNITKEKSTIGRNNYAVVWDWATKDKELVNENASIFTNELIKLWQNNDIENVYFNNKAKIKEDMHFPSISFFVKAHNLNSAKSILDNLTIVKKGIAHYKLYPVGMLWLKQTPYISKINNSNTSFVTIWKTMGKKPTNILTKTQNDTILALWKRGTIENIYFDVEGILDTINKTDFVFYIKDMNIDEAEKICKSLPFYKENVATYQIFPAGIFWLGICK